MTSLIGRVVPSRQIVRVTASPGALRSSSACRSPALRTGRPFTFWITSPGIIDPSAARWAPRSPAAAAGELGRTPTTISPSTPNCWASCRPIASEREIPSRGRATLPWATSWGTIRFTVSPGIAKPMPAYAPDGL